MGTIQSDAQQGETYRLLGLRLQEPMDSPDAPFRAAIDAFNKAIAQAEAANKKYAWGYAHRGASYRSLGCVAHSVPEKEDAYTKAQNDFQQAIELDSQYAWAYAQQGENYCCWGVDITSCDHYQGRINLNEAIKAFDKAINLNPDYEWAYAHRGVVYRFLGGFFANDANSRDQPNFDKAVSDLEQAVKLNPKYAWAYAYLAAVHREKAQAYEYFQDEQAKDEWKLAFHNVQKAIQILPRIFSRPVLRVSNPFFPPHNSFLTIKSPKDKYDLYAIAVSKIHSEGLDNAQKEIQEALAALRGS